MLVKAFKLFDCDGDGLVSTEELRMLVERAGGSITQGEATALIRQADKDFNGKLDYSEFRELWAIVRGEVEVSQVLTLL